MAKPVLEVLHHRKRKSIVGFILRFPKPDKDFCSLLIDLLHKNDLDAPFAQCIVILALIDADSINPQVLIHEL